MASTIQTFDGVVATTGDEVVVKWSGTLYPGEVTDIDTQTDTPVITVTEDGIGPLTGLTFADVPPGQREGEPDGTWFWKHKPH